MDKREKGADDLSKDSIGSSLLGKNLEINMKKAAVTEKMQAKDGKNNEERKTQGGGKGVNSKPRGKGPCCRSR